MLIDETSRAALENEKTFWNDTLINTRLLLFSVDKAIYALTQDDKKSYSMDTGQTTINVTLQDLPGLIDRREKLIKQIDDLEDKLSIAKTQTLIIQGIPQW